MMQHARDRHAFRLDVHGARLRRTNFSHANLKEANLSGADFTEANFRGSDFKNANLSGTILRGADLTDVTNLTREQLATAILDDQTKLPILADNSAPAK
jgi:uncharacterized protein YjbI with pentapeptide repeats